MIRRPSRLPTNVRALGVTVALYSKTAQRMVINTSMHDFTRAWTEKSLNNRNDKKNANV
jgi:hypothetical protein